MEGPWASSEEGQVKSTSRNWLHQRKGRKDGEMSSHVSTSIILSLASRNLASRGSSQHLYEPDNGNFLKEIELLAKFDPVMENHLARIKDKSTHTHYLGQRIQIELIQIISDRVLQTIVSCVQEAKYYSIILDCTPDASHKDVSRTVQCCTETQARS